MSHSDLRSNGVRSEAARTAVRESRVFSGLGPETIEELLAASELRTVRAGEVVCRPGEPGDHVALVVSGLLDAEAPGSRGGAPLNRIGPGELFGEMAVLRGTPRSAWVTAAVDGVLLILDQAVFLSLLVRHPAVAIRLLGSVSDRLHRLTEALGRDLAAATP